jgi:hypothetical protein
MRAEENRERNAENPSGHLPTSPALHPSSAHNLDDLAPRFSLRIARCVEGSLALLPERAGHAIEPNFIAVVVGWQAPTRRRSPACERIGAETPLKYSVPTPGCLRVSLHR